MELELALLADAANSSREGKLNICGIFDTITANKFPIQYPQICLVLRFKADTVEAGRTYKIEIQIINEDGKKLASLQADLVFNDSANRNRAIPMKVDHMLNFSNATFEKPGTYEFVIFINDEIRKRVPLYLLSHA